MKKSLSLLAIFGLLLSFGLVNHVNAEAPAFPIVPDVKLFIGQGLTPAFDLVDYNTKDAATTAAIQANFLGLSSLDVTSVGNEVTSAKVSFASYGSATVGANVFRLANEGGAGDAISEVKISTFKIGKLPTIPLSPGDTWVVNVGALTINNAGPALAPSFGNPASLVVSDPTRISAAWTAPGVVTVTALPAFTGTEFVDVIAAPVATPPFGVDVDVERIAVRPILSPAAFKFNAAADMAAFAIEPFAPGTLAPPVTWVASVNDGLGRPSKGGVAQVNVTAGTQTLKLTASLANFMHAEAGKWYTLRARVSGTNPALTYLQFLYNWLPGVTPGDVQGYFRWTMPTTWTYIDIPVISAAPSPATTLYPQVVIQPLGATGMVNIDELLIFQAAPTLVDAGRLITRAKYHGSIWNISTGWNFEPHGASQAATSITGGKLLVTTAGAASQGIKVTAGPGPGLVNTVSANVGRQFGMQMETRQVSGVTQLFGTMVQLNVMGTAGPNSTVLAHDIFAAAEVGRISNRTLLTAANALGANYQLQFVVVNQGASVIEIDATDALVDNDDFNYGDAILFP